MLSTQNPPSLQMPSAAEPPRSARLNPQTPSFIPQSPSVTRGPNTGNGEAFDNWLDGFAQHQGTLQAMAEASLDAKFQEELGTIEQWFKVLSEAERTASIYALIQHSTQNQIRFFIAVLQQMVRAADGPLSAAIDAQQTNGNPRSLRPPSLNLPVPRTPGTPQFSAGPANPAFGGAGTPDSSKGNKRLGEIAEESDIPLRSAGLSLNLGHDDWASMVNTPLGNMFPKRIPQSAGIPKSSGLDQAFGLLNGGGVGAFGNNNMNMMGVSQEAQLLAMQLVMSGMVQPGIGLPGGIQMPQPNIGNKSNNQRGHKTVNSNGSNNWRSNTGSSQQQSNAGGGRLPRNGAKSPGAKSPSGGNSNNNSKAAASVTSAGAGSRPDDEVDPELIKDVAAWLKSLRLHKYTPSFEGMTWQQMVVLDDAALEKKGVAALGARRRLIRTFENVRKRMGMEPADEPSGASTTEGSAT